MYTRVIPRDLFNEAKLLKCLGQLSLAIHDGSFGNALVQLNHDTDEFDGFRIEQNDHDGSLFVANLALYVAGNPVELSSIYNSKSTYPLTFDCDGSTGYVFDDDGKPSGEFLGFLNPAEQFS